MHTASTFVARFPEFADTDLSLVQACLDSASFEIDPDVFGDRTNEAHGLLAAHKLGMSPGGMNARLVLPNGQASTTYYPQYQALVAMCTSGFRVT